MTRRWYKLLIHWTEREFRHSLTFPFLVGALRKPPAASLSPEESASAELEALIRDISELKAEQELFHIYRCPGLGELVLHKVNGTYQPPGSIAIGNQTPSAGALFASDTSLAGEEAAPIDLADIIWQEVGDAILEGRFSCNGGKYQAFSEYDLKVISRAFA